MPNYLPIEKRKQIFHLLVEGNGVRGITRLIGCSKGAVSEIQKRYCMITSFLSNRYIKDLNIEEIEADEIRTFVLKKTNLRWIYIALDRKSKLVIHFHIGKRDANDARVFLIGLTDKLSKKSKVSTDRLDSYIAAVTSTPEGYLRNDAFYVDLESARYFGKVLGRGITNRIESHNGNVRQHISRLTRKTRCFSKKDEGLRQHLTLFFFYYNFIKTHKTIKTTPAVSLGILEKPFTFDELIQYDLMFTGKKSNVNSQKNYGRIENKVDKSELELFIDSLNNSYGIKSGTIREGKGYKKLRIVA